MKNINFVDETNPNSLGGGGASSWNDLEDKPFGEEYVSLGDTLTWDGVATEDTISFQGMLDFQKLSIDTLTNEELDSGEIVYTLDGVENTLPIKGNYYNTDGYVAINVTGSQGDSTAFVVIPYDGYTPPDMPVTFAEKGVYAVRFAMMGTVGKSITIPGKDFKWSTVKQIPTKYIPNYQDVVCVNLSYDADADTYTVDRTYDDLKILVSFGSKLAMEYRFSGKISGATTQIAAYTDNFAWTHASLSGVVEGHILFTFPPEKTEGGLTIRTCCINRDNTVEMLSATIATS